MGDRLGIRNVLDNFYSFTKHDVKTGTQMGDPLQFPHRPAGICSIFLTDYQGIARTQSPTNKNYALELPTFGAIVGVSQTEVQWNGLTLEEPPS